MTLSARSAADDEKKSTGGAFGSSRPVCGAFIAWRKPIAAAAAAAIFRCTLNARTCIVHPQTENRHQIPIRAPFSVAASFLQFRSDTTKSRHRQLDMARVQPRVESGWVELSGRHANIQKAYNTIVLLSYTSSTRYNLHSSACYLLGNGKGKSLA